MILRLMHSPRLRSTSDPHGPGKEQFLRRKWSSLSSPAVYYPGSSQRNSIPRVQKVDQAKTSPRAGGAAMRFSRMASAPERLLFMTETELQNISGIDGISLGEILRYHKQCLSGA